MCKLTVFLFIVLISRRVQHTSAQRIETSDLLESILNEVFMPCVENVTSNGQPMLADTENATQSDTAINVTKTLINESAAMSVVISHMHSKCASIPTGLVSVYRMSQDKDFVIISSLVMTLSLFHLSERA